jgi:hypothetical protein
MNSTIIPLIIENPNTYNESMLDSIYDYAKVKPLFIGDLQHCNNPAPQKSVEEYEGFIPWLFTSLRLAYEPKEIISIIARQTDTNFNKKKSSYEDSFKKGINNFKNSIDFLDLIANTHSIKEYSKNFKIWIDDKYENVDQKNQKLNITYLTTSKWDTFFTCATLIYFLTNKIHGSRANNERYISVTNTFFSKALEKLKSDDMGNPSECVKKLELANNGLQNRYEFFWKVVADATLEEITKELNGNINISKYYTVLENELAEKGFSTKQVYIYDRRNSTDFELFLISFDEQNLQKGHIIADLPLAYGNIVLQSPKDNAYNDNHPIDDMDSYTQKYMSQLKEWATKNNADTMAILKTEIFLNSWKSQKQINI